MIEKWEVAVYKSKLLGALLTHLLICMGFRLSPAGVNCCKNASMWFLFNISTVTYPTGNKRLKPMKVTTRDPCFFGDFTLTLLNQFQIPKNLTHKLCEGFLFNLNVQLTLR